MLVKINLILAIFLTLIAIGLSQPKPGPGGPGGPGGRGGRGSRGGPGGPGDDKFCDKSVSTDQMTKMSDCEKFVPQQVKTNVDTCLKKLNKGTTFQEFRNTVCDDSLGPQFMECQRNIIKTQIKSGNKPSDDDRQADRKAMKEHFDCMQGVLGS